MSKISPRKRSPVFNFFRWCRRASQKAVQTMESFVSFKSRRPADNSGEYVAKILKDPNFLVFQDSWEASPSACSMERAVYSSFKSEDNFTKYLGDALRDPSLLCSRQGEKQPISTNSMPLKLCSISKSDHSFADYFGNATTEQNTLDFRNNHDENVSTCSVPRDACLSLKSDVINAEYLAPSKFEVDSRGGSLSTCSITRETNPFADVAPPDAWSNRNGERSSVGLSGNLNENTSTRLAAIFESQKSQMFERPPNPIEGSGSVIFSTGEQRDHCQCIEENLISTVSSAKPKLPARFFDLPTTARLRAVKQFLAEFDYRLNSVSSFQIKKLRPLSGLMATAKLLPVVLTPVAQQIIYQPEPIKCVEAVFIALFLTAGLPLVERIPLGFKTQFANQVFQHMVLLVQHKGKYGAFGISRSPDLMNKEISYDSMSSIIGDFKTAYEESDHTILNLQIGLPVEHNIMSSNFVCWEHLCLHPANQPWPECVAAIENHALQMKRLWNVWMISGRGADPTRKPIKLLRKAPLDDGSKKIVSSVERKETLRKSATKRKQLEGRYMHSRRQAYASAPNQFTAISKNECQHSREQRKPAIARDTISINKLVLKGSFDHRESTGPWKYVRNHDLYHHGQGSMLLEADARFRGPLDQDAWKHCDCRGLLCSADLRLPAVGNKIRGPGPLHNMVVKRAGAG